MDFKVQTQVDSDLKWSRSLYQWTNWKTDTGQGVLTHWAIWLSSQGHSTESFSGDGQTSAAVDFSASRGRASHLFPSDDSKSYRCGVTERKR